MTEPVAPDDPQPPAGNRRRVVLVALAAVVAAASAFVVVRAGDDDVETADTASSTTSSTTTTAEPPDTEPEPPFTPEVDHSLTVFPDPTTARRFDDPEALALAFATDFVGMSDPIVGELMEGDTRSGEIELRAFPQAEPTVVAVRLLEDDTWFVVAASTESIQPSAPVPGAVVASPLALAGQAYAFEGTVQVALHADGQDEPIATTFVTGRGDGIPGPYEGSVEFTAPQGVDFGVILYTSSGGEEGGPLQATAMRVSFSASG